MLLPLFNFARILRVHDLIRTSMSFALSKSTENFLDQSSCCKLTEMLFFFKKKKKKKKRLMNL